MFLPHVPELLIHSVKFQLTVAAIKSDSCHGDSNLNLSLGFNAVVLHAYILMNVKHAFL